MLSIKHYERPRAGVCTVWPRKWWLGWSMFLLGDEMEIPEHPWNPRVFVSKPRSAPPTQVIRYA